MKSKNADKNKAYELTLKGVLCTCIDDPALTQVLMNIELYMRRRGYNGIVLEDTGFEFVKLEKREEPNGEVPAEKA